MSVGLLVVRFQYGLYVVVNLSKFITLFRVNSLLCRVVLRLLPTFGYAIVVGLGALKNEAQRNV